MTVYHAEGITLRDQAKPQFNIEPSIQYYMNLVFQIRMRWKRQILT
jgi:hypothetical protein